MGQNAWSPTWIWSDYVEPDRKEGNMKQEMTGMSPQLLCSIWFLLCVNTSWNILVPFEGTGDRELTLGLIAYLTMAGEPSLCFLLNKVPCIRYTKKPNSQKHRGKWSLIWVHGEINMESGNTWISVLSHTWNPLHLCARYTKMFRWWDSEPSKISFRSCLPQMRTPVFS